MYFCFIITETTYADNITNGETIEITPTEANVATESSVRNDSRSLPIIIIPQATPTTTGMPSTLTEEEYVSSSPSSSLEPATLSN